MSVISSPLARPDQRFAADGPWAGRCGEAHGRKGGPGGSQRGRGGPSSTEWGRRLERAAATPAVVARRTARPGRPALWAGTEPASRRGQSPTSRRGARLRIDRKPPPCVSAVSVPDYGGKSVSPPPRLAHGLERSRASGGGPGGRAPGGRRPLAEETQDPLMMRLARSVTSKDRGCPAAFTRLPPAPASSCSPCRLAAGTVTGEAPRRRQRAAAGAERQAAPRSSLS